MLNQILPSFFTNKICNCPATWSILTSHYRMLEGTWLHITAFPTHMVRPLDESQGSSPLQGHSSWLMCEVALIKPLSLRYTSSSQLLIEEEAWSVVQKCRPLRRPCYPHFPKFPNSSLDFLILIGHAYLSDVWSSVAPTLKLKKYVFRRDWTTYLKCDSHST